METFAHWHEEREALWVRDSDLVWVRWLVWMAGVLGLELGLKPVEATGARGACECGMCGALVELDDLDAALSRVASVSRHPGQRAAALRARWLWERGLRRTRWGLAMRAKGAFCMLYASRAFGMWRRLFRIYVDFTRGLRGDARLPPGFGAVRAVGRGPPGRWEIGRQTSGALSQMAGKAVCFLSSVVCRG